MSTVAVGNAFEDRVFAAIRRELALARLGFDVRCCKLKQHERYFSAARNDFIETDISIEVWPPDAPQWSFLWVCECKFRESAVSVDAVERLKAELDQIAGAASKGVIAISGAIQRGALNYAKSHRIAVIRLLPEEQIEHVLHYGTAPEPATEDEMVRALTDPAFIGTAEFYCDDSGKALESWRDVLTRTLSGAVSAAAAAE